MGPCDLLDTDANSFHAGTFSETTSATQKLIDLKQQQNGSNYGGIYASMVLPSLILGTVGGGTALATQKECLSMMGCYGKVGKFNLRSSKIHSKWVPGS